MIPTRPMASFMQTQAFPAYGRTTSRPSAHLVQDLLHVTSNDANSSDSSDRSDSSDFLYIGVARCSRCQRTPSLNVRTGKSNMLQYGLNLWYCNRYAVLVGMNR